jgi:uncharacterized membrane protein YcaP (DUF421 family)
MMLVVFVMVVVVMVVMVVMLVVTMMRTIEIILDGEVIILINKTLTCRDRLKAGRAGKSG